MGVALNSMPTVAVSPPSKISPPLSSLGISISHVSSPETLRQECRDTGISLSSPRQAKRRPAIVMMESEDEDYHLGSNHTTPGQKRQKFAKSQLIGAPDEVPPTASGNSKAFRYLQEQREKLPIARGETITNLHNNDKASDLRLFPLLGRESLMRSIALNDVTIILGETGSGKTTRMSLFPSY
jgi:HrpA-like RNA helicase